MTKQLLIFLAGFAAFTLNGQYSYLEKAERSIDIDSSIFYAEKNLNVAENSGDSVRIIDGICLLARKYTIKSFYTRAEKLIEKCFSYRYVEKCKDCQGKLYLELGSIYKYEGAYQQSLIRYLSAKKIFEDSRNWQLVTKCNVELAEYYRKLGKYENAREFIDQSFNTYTKNTLTDTSLLIQIYGRAAAIENESSDVQASLRDSRMALQLAKKSGDKYAEATSLNELGYTCKNLRKNDSAEFFYKTAEQIWFSIGADREALSAMNNRAMLYMHNGYSEKVAIQLYHDIIKITKEKKVYYPLENVYGYLWHESIKDGDTGAAFRYFYLYHQNDSVSTAKKNDLAVTNITEKYENEKATKEFVRVSDELSSSKAQNRKMFFFISIFVVLFLVIAILLWRLKKTNKVLSDRNREKDVLIQEIHHRVKNNLQFISSLINLQMNSSSDTKEIHTLHDASRRIRAMGLVHEMLYNHKESMGISVKQYLEELILLLDQLVNSERVPIEFKLQIADENFNISDSIALGMIASELVSNSIKHAFKNIEKPEIEVTLKKEDKLINFSVRDNGEGGNMEPKQKKTLGLRLIDIFSRQLKGAYTISTLKGCSYELKFSLR